MVKITYQSLSEQGILQKLVVAVMLMFIVPLVLTFYIFYTEAEELLHKGSVQLIILLMVSMASFGYLLSRRLIMSIIKITKVAQSIARGDRVEKIETSEKNEINELAQYFNQITAELEKNIEDLKESKKLTQQVLLRIGIAMTSAKKVESTLGLTLETLTHALNARSGAIMLLEKDKLRVMVSCGINSEKQKDIEIPYGEGVMGWVVKEKKSQNVSKMQENEWFEFEAQMGLVHKTVICAPLIYKDKILGTISLHDKEKDGEFTEDDLILLENLAAQTAIAIENNRLNKDIEKTYIETISALALAVEAKDPYNRGHSKRVNKYVVKLGKEFSLDRETMRVLQDAALLHDIGKIGIKDEIILKPGSLNAEEKSYIQQHAIIGENILKPIHSLTKVAYLVRHHQERVNGKGYPDGLTSEEMSLPLKVLIICDAYDAMTSDRPYRKAMSKQEAYKELKKYSGIYFAPKIVEAFIRVI